jgi:hypothetical protein
MHCVTVTFITSIFMLDANGSNDGRAVMRAMEIVIAGTPQ